MSIDSDLSSFEPNTNTGSGGMMVPILIAIAGLLVGGAALYFSLGGTGKVDDANAELEAITAKAEGLETRLRDLEEKYNAMDSELKTSQSTVRRMASDINKEFKEAGVEINRNRDMIEQSADKLTELITTLNRGSRPTVANDDPPTPTAPAAPSAPSRPSATGLPATDAPTASSATDPVIIGATPITHTIRSGDTFTKLSKQYSVSTTAILAANPDVDPRRLAVGQKIRIPVN